MSLVSHMRQLKAPIPLSIGAHPCLSFDIFLLYLYHYFLIIGMLFRLVGIK